MPISESDRRELEAEFDAALDEYMAEWAESLASADDAEQSPESPADG